MLKFIANGNFSVKTAIRGNNDTIKVHPKVIIPNNI